MDNWRQSLNTKTEQDLLKTAGGKGWTMGQVYMHLANSARFFHLAQVKKCTTGREGHDGKKNFKGKLAMNILKSFPPIRVQIPPSEAYTPKQPGSKKDIEAAFDAVHREMNEAKQLFVSDAGGKTAHPAFGYLGAAEWYRLIEMHWRHHLRQKQRIEQA